MHEARSPYVARVLDFCVGAVKMIFSMTVLFAFVPQALVRIAIRPHVFAMTFIFTVLPFALIPDVMWHNYAHCTCV